MVVYLIIYSIIWFMLWYMIVYSGATWEGDCSQSNGTGHKQDSSHCTDYKEESSSIASRYRHQFSQHNWCMGTNWRRSFAVSFYRLLICYYNQIIINFCLSLKLLFWYLDINAKCSVEMTRQVSMISITLSPKELNKNSPG